jgi:hypothetical protein
VGCPKGGVVHLTLTLLLTENAGFSPAFIYERRSLSSKKKNLT